LHTGGVEFGAISTKSSPDIFAKLIASSIGTTPLCLLSLSINLTSLEVIL